MPPAFNLAAYLSRIGVSRLPSGRLSALSALMAAQSREIAFENLDVVQRKPISMEAADVEAKLVARGRGGYCFEQNTLLQSALRALEYEVHPLLCRVRWNKRADEPSTFTHVILKVTLPADELPADELEHAGEYLVDVGFSSINSIAPIRLGTDQPQRCPEGRFRVLADPDGYSTLQWEIGEAWRSLYRFRQDEPACGPDLECANWWSCTWPSARFTSQFFVSRIVGEAKHHILDNEYAIRQRDGAVETRPIADRDELLTLLTTVFGIRLPEDTEGLDRYLPQRG